MRIALCTDQYVPLLSGVADSVAILADQLRRNGHAVRVYTMSLPGAVPDPDVMRFPIYTLPGAGEGMAIVLPRGAMHDIREFKPDVIHTHLVGMVGLFALWASWRLRVPLVGTDHTFPADYLHYLGLDYAPFRSLVKTISAWYYNRCVVVSAPSNSILQELRDYGCTAPMQVISNHIPAEIFHPLPNTEELKKKYGIGEKAVLLFGRIAIEKHLDIALAAFEQIAATSSAELVFVGDGPYHAELKKIVAGKSFAARVKFLGTRRGAELVEIINACDVFMITSRSETQSMTTMQAMACGLPVVVANAGGLPEYVHDGHNGYVIEAKDAAAYAARVLQLLEDPARARELGERGRESVQDFSPIKITAFFETLYTKAIDSIALAVV